MLNIQMYVWSQPTWGNFNVKKKIKKIIKMSFHSHLASPLLSKPQKGSCSPDYWILSPYVLFIPHINQLAIKEISRTDRLQTANLYFTLLINSERMNITTTFILLSYQIFTFNTLMHLSFILQIKCVCSLYLTAF